MVMECEGKLEWTEEQVGAMKTGQNATDCPPQYRRNIHFGPVSGLMSGSDSTSAPSRAVTQWPIADG